MDISIAMPIFNNYIVIGTPNNTSNKTYIVMTHITKEEEEDITKGKTVVLERGDKRIELNKSICFFWGEIDFNKDSDDCQQIDKADILNAKGRDFIIPAQYDFDTHTCKTPQNIGKYMITEANTSSEILRYKYGCLNKPERVVLFKKKVW